MLGVEEKIARVEELTMCWMSVMLPDGKSVAHGDVGQQVGDGRRKMQCFEMAG